MEKLRGLMIDGCQIVDSTAHWVTRTLPINFHRVSTHGQIASTLPQGIHGPFNE